MGKAIKNEKEEAKHEIIPFFEYGFIVKIKSFFEEVTRFTKFTGLFLKESVTPPYEWNELIKQSYQIGYKSFPLITVTGFIIGLVLTIQTRPTLATFGAESWLPAMISVSIVREIGPMITALIFAGKVGSGIGAEIASMKVTEQIDAMEVSGMNPFKYIVVTRTIASILMLPLLVFVADAIAIYGSFVGANLNGTVSFQLFFAQVFNTVSFSDIFPAVIKTFLFGMAVGLISCYKGYTANRGTESVGIAANTSVVLGSLFIFFIDMVAVQLTSIFIKT